MGEGKTSVILPLLSLIISNGINCISQIMLLSSIFNTNLNMFRYIFGMLGRNIIILPFSRDKNFNNKYLLNILNKYLKNKCIILSKPEYDMSFNLKLKEAKFKKNTKQIKYTSNFY